MDDNDFDRQFDNHFRNMKSMAIVAIALWFGVLVFVGWVIVKVMGYFGIV